MNIPEKKEQWKLSVLILKQIAESKGLSQNEISERSGLIQSNISRLFNLKFKPTIDTFLQICNAIKISMNFEDEENIIDFDQILEKAKIELSEKEDTLKKK